MLDSKGNVQNHTFKCRVQWVEYLWIGLATFMTREVVHGHVRCFVAFQRAPMHEQFAASWAAVHAVAGWFGYQLLLTAAVAHHK